MSCSTTTPSTRGEGPWAAAADDPAGHELHLINIHTISGQAERFIPGKDAHARSRFKKTCVKNPIMHVASTLAATQSASTLAATQSASTLAATQSVNPYWVVMGDCQLTKDEAMDMAQSLPMKVHWHGDSKDFIFSSRALVHHERGPPLVAHDHAHTAVIAGVQPIEVLHMS